MQETVTAIVQVEGRLKARLEVPADISPDDLEATALADAAVANTIDGREVRRVTVRAPKLVNVIV